MSHKYSLVQYSSMCWWTLRN